jgi:hypothetical protein
MILIVGATDRLPLAGRTRARYEANTGLALARAAAVKDFLAGECWTKSAKMPDDKNVLLLVSGPHNTPADDGNAQHRPPHGYPQDRRVEVWALTSQPAPPADAIKSVRRDVGSDDPSASEVSSGGGVSTFGTRPSP